MNTDKDPDWHRKIVLSDWRFPMTKFKLAKVYLKIFLTGGFLWHFLMGFIFVNTLRAEKRGFKKFKLVAGRLTYYSLLVGGLVYFNLWQEYLYYFYLPFWFIFPVLDRTRSISEHFGLKRDHKYSNARNIKAPFWETYFFGPHSINYHLDHHLYANIPHYNLKKLNEILMQDPEYRAHAHENDGYFRGNSPVVNDVTFS